MSFELPRLFLERGAFSIQARNNFVYESLCLLEVIRRLVYSVKYFGQDGLLSWREVYKNCFSALSGIQP
jgi:hypothetical protein